MCLGNLEKWMVYRSKGERHSSIIATVKHPETIHGGSRGSAHLFYPKMLL